MRLLVVTSECAPAPGLISALQAHAFVVDLASPAIAVDSAMHVDYELVLVDLDDGKLNCSSFLRGMRRNGWPGRVMALKTSSTVSDRVAGLNAGADDFVCKPIAAEELAARIQALLRRSIGFASVFQVADLTVDPVRRLATRAGRAIQLTHREFELLEFLVRNRERPLTRARILRHVWNENFDGLTNVVDVYINYLRRKIDDGFPLKLICTARGVGYVLRDPALLKTLAPEETGAAAA
jgi:DNA-binding response OmpR family regulator